MTRFENETKAERYWYDSGYDEGSVTRPAPGKTILRGEDYDEMEQAEPQMDTARRAAIAQSQATPRLRIVR